MGKFSFTNMFLDADPIVQGIMILLGLASIASWSVIAEKTAVLRRVSRHIWGFKKMAALGDHDIKPKDFPGFTVMIVEAGLKEALDRVGDERRAAFRERTERAMRGTYANLLYLVEARTSLLATVGSTSPFIGLFGTVWGIMHSFLGIASTGETTLAVVAPGIAEALSATAIGLVAAIPAVIAFNKINSTIKKISKEAITAIGLMGNTLASRHYQGPDEEMEAVS
ncbi:MAG: MotA/TolQ/ExbB proton channel family protein [Deltaproteobacteria bacterium]|jgi:biopolymer transport protein ExbB/TolQ|nr:MotA/TolQ/ExbB proton channel family protein [Deltaproteobacteria bacterium]